MSCLIVAVINESHNVFSRWQHVSQHLYGKKYDAYVCLRNSELCGNSLCMEVNGKETGNQIDKCQKNKIG